MIRRIKRFELIKNISELKSKKSWWKRLENKGSKVQTERKRFRKHQPIQFNQWNHEMWNEMKFGNGSIIDPLPVENYHINICRQKKETKSF
jgi:hypothetical protein